MSQSVSTQQVQILGHEISCQGWSSSSALRFNTWHRHPSIRVRLLQHFVQAILPQIHPSLFILTAVTLVQATLASHLGYKACLPRASSALPSLQLLLHAASRAARLIKTQRELQMQATCSILNFLVATYKKVNQKQVKWILVTFYLTQNIIISICTVCVCVSIF